MPDVELSGIEFQIAGSMDSKTPTNIKRLATALSSLKEAVNGLDNDGVKKLRELAIGFYAISKATQEGFKITNATINKIQKIGEAGANIPKGAGDKLRDLADGLAKLKEVGDFALPNVKTLRADYLKDKPLDIPNFNPNQGETVADTFGTDSSAADTLKEITENGIMARKTMFDLSGAISTVGQAFSNTLAPIGSFLKSIKRIAMYRLIRTVLKEITQGFSEGMKNAYQYSSVINGQFAKSMDNLATSTMYLKNSLGGMMMPIMNALAPVIEYLINGLVTVLNLINQIFSILNGASSWTKALKLPQKWGEAASGATEKIKELQKTILGFDEINKLNKQNTPSGGGGAGGADFSNMFEEAAFNEKLKDLIGKMQMNFNDILFKWTDLTPEDIAKKAIFALSTFLGTAAGFIIGGIPGAIVGTLIGGTMGLLIDSIIFNNDGTLGRDEIGEMLRLALIGLTGGIIGFTLGGVKGALIGMSFGISLYGLIKTIDFFNEDFNGDQLLNNLVPVLAGIGGAIIGFKIGGVGGAVIGATIGLGIGFAVEQFMFSDFSNWSTSTWVGNIVAALAPAAGAIIGLAVGGPGGAAIGATIGLGIHFLLKTDPKADGEESAQGWFDGVKEKTSHGFTFLKEHFFKPVTDGVKSLFGIHSPSTVFKEFGEQTIQGYYNGMSNKFPSVLTFVQSKLNEIKGKFSSLTLKFPEIQLPHIPTPHFSLATGIMGIQYPQFDGWWAQGGFPESGSLFIANERGAEMVGSMGGRTAVANNQEIVSGIRQGVREANSDEVRLLREQNEILRALLDKDNTATISIGAVTQALQRKNQRDGGTSVPVFG